MGREFLLGFNYWARGLGTSMWRDWRPDIIESDIKLMSELGVNAIRFFIMLQDFSDPHADVIKESCKNLRNFLLKLKEYGIKGYATLLVGHMSGRNWIIPFEGKEGVYSLEFIHKLRKFLKSLISCVGKDVIRECIGGWVISNELMLYARPKSRSEYLGFVKAVKELINELDPGKPVGLGDVSDKGSEPPNMAEVADYNSFHLYYYDADVVRHGLTYAFATDLYSLGGEVPVIAEELGFSSAQYSDEEIAKFLRVALTTVLANGASGAMIWCFADFDREGEPPYLWKPFELRFGVVNSNGKLKPQAKVVKEFAKIINELRVRGIYGRFKVLKDPIAITYPAFIYRDDIQFITYDFIDIITNLLESYVALKTLGLNPIVIPEEYLPKFKGSTKLVVVPSIPTLLSTTWRFFIRYTEEGGVLYYSFAKYLSWLHEAPTHLWSELFSVKPSLPAGSVGSEPPSKLIINYEGKERTVRVPRGRGDVLGYRFSPLNSEVIGRDELGNPQVFINKLGKGYAILNSVPIEALSYNRFVIDEYREDLQMLYSLLLKTSNISPKVLVKASQKSLETVIWGNEGNEYVLFLINHSQSPIKAEVLLNNIIRGYEIIGSLDMEVIELTNNKLLVEGDGRSSTVIYLET